MGQAGGRRVSTTEVYGRVSAALTTDDIAACRPAGIDLIRATRKLHRKAISVGLLAVGSYVGMLAVHNVLLAIPLAIGLTIAIIAIGTCIMHDANHGAFSESKALNRVVGYSSDLVGASSWLWRQKHNGLHHANTNVVGIDTDIEQMPFARLAPAQPWRPWHRFQHLYMWPLYGFLTVQWALFSDLATLATRKIGSQPLRRKPKFSDLTMLILGKVLHFGWAVGLPMFFHRWWVVVAFYMSISWCVGFALAVFFQVAHCVDTTTFVSPETPRRGDQFALHQLSTTANVECHTPIIGSFTAWLMGGLHQQIEHHLAPGVPHTAYEVMGKKIRELCEARGISYRTHTSMTAALRSHMRWLRAMGVRPSIATGV